MCSTFCIHIHLLSSPVSATLARSHKVDLRASDSASLALDARRKKKCSNNIARSRPASGPIAPRRVRPRRWQLCPTICTVDTVVPADGPACMHCCQNCLCPFARTFCFVPSRLCSKVGERSCLSARGHPSPSVRCCPRVYVPGASFSVFPSCACKCD